MLPGAAGMFVAFGMLLLVQYLAADREDGTLLRARATPHGIRGYLVGKVVLVCLTVVAYLVILLVPGALLVGGLSPGPAGWITFGWVLVLVYSPPGRSGPAWGAWCAAPAAPASSRCPSWR